MFPGRDTPTPSQQSDAVDRLSAGEVQWELPVAEHDLGRHVLSATRVELDSSESTLELGQARSSEAVGESIVFHLALHRGERAVSDRQIARLDVVREPNLVHVDARLDVIDDRARRSEIAHHMAGVVDSLADHASLPVRVEGHDATLLQILAGMGFHSALDLRDDVTPGASSWLVERTPDRQPVVLDTVDASVLARVGQRLLDHRPRPDTSSDDAPVSARLRPTDLVPDVPDVVVSRVDADNLDRTTAVAFGTHLARSVRPLGDHAVQRTDAPLGETRPLRVEATDDLDRSDLPRVASLLVGLLALVGLVRRRSPESGRVATDRRAPLQPSHESDIAPLVDHAEHNTRQLIDALVDSAAITVALGESQLPLERDPATLASTIEFDPESSIDLVDKSDPRDSRPKTRAGKVRTSGDSAVTQAVSVGPDTLVAGAVGPAQPATDLDLDVVDIVDQPDETAEADDEDQLQAGQ